MDIAQVLQRVPDYKAFFTVDELRAALESLAVKRGNNDENAGEASLFILGRSRKGEDIPCLKIGSGDKNAICYACPHPNEPIGAMTVVTMAKLFLEDAALLRETGYTWYLIPCIDPDGTRLNEGWFKGPFDLSTYDRHFYRPAGNAQVEWTFPYKYKTSYFDDPIPETRALMALIEKVRPRFVFSLHNAAFGGAYWYISKNIPELNPLLEGSATRQGIPLHRGEPEAAYCDKYSKSVFSMLSLIRSYEHREAKGQKVPEGKGWCGTCGADFINTVCDCLTMMAELPYFNDPRIADESPSASVRRDAAIFNAQAKKASLDFITANWRDIRPLFGDDNPFPRLVDDCIRWGKADEAKGTPQERFTGPEYERMATVAEEYDSMVLMRNFDALNVALCVRACEAAIAAPGEYTKKQLEALEKGKAAFLGELERMCADIEAKTDYTAIPIKKLVSVQLESALHAIRFA